MKISRNFIIIFLVIILLIAGGVFYFLNSNKKNTTNATSPSTSNSSNSNTSYVDTVTKVAPPAPVDVSKYKLLDLADGRQVLSVPKELVTREPFATALNKITTGNEILPNNLIFFYNPTSQVISTFGINLINFETVLIQNKEAWVFSLRNIDGTEQIFYSLPDFVGQRKLAESPILPIVKWNKTAPSILEVTVNKSQRGQQLTKYTIDFSTTTITYVSPYAPNTDTPPKVISVDL